MKQSLWLLDSAIFRYQSNKKALNELRLRDPMIDRKLDEMTPDEKAEFFRNHEYLKKIRNHARLRNTESPTARPQDLINESAYWRSMREAQDLADLKKNAAAQRENSKEYDENTNVGPERVERFRHHLEQREKGFAKRIFRRFKIIQSRHTAKIDSASGNTLVVDGVKPSHLHSSASLKAFFRSRRSS